MRLLVGLFVLSLYAMLGSVSAQYQQYQVGKHYVKLPPGAQAVSSDKVEVREFFWYGCPHCYRLEPYLEAWLKNIPADVDYVRTPGVARRWLPHAQAFYTFEALGVTEQVHKDFFDVIHNAQAFYTFEALGMTERVHKDFVNAISRGQKLHTEDSLVQFLAAYGVEASKVRQSYNSSRVRNQVQNAKRLEKGDQVEDSLVQFLAGYGVEASKVRNNYNSFGVRTKVENAKRLNFLYAIASVPTITVDGRYKTDVSMAGGPQQLMALINYLVDQSRQERKRTARGK